MKVFNTLTRTKEEFVPRKPGEVSIYVCGITPYNYAHIGNSRPAVFWDCVRRYLIYRGYKVHFIQNFTDVDDKIINRAAQLGKEPLQLSEEYARIYLEDLQKLGVMPADRYPKVSEHIPEIIEMIKTLVEKGFAYEANGDVYYEVGRFDEYGKLSGRNLDELQAGARVEVNEAKRNPMDFALWKAAKPGEIAWDSPWGPGRPGWHIECSAMSLKYLGGGFDMHGGGEDLVFPHHENEVAQSEAYLGSQFARYWLHNAFVTVSGERMGKSMGNFSTIRDVIEKYPPKVVRFWLVGTHYRNPIGFGEEELNAAAKGLERLETARFNWTHLLNQPAISGKSDEEMIQTIRKRIGQTRDEFVAGMDDDFNTPQALASLYELVREVNRWIQEKEFQLTEENQQVLTEALSTLDELGGILGLFLEEASTSPDQSDTAEIEALIAQRTQAKKEKNWALADQIRDQLKERGIILEDTPQGVRWRRE
ncbi:MAG TPA: cysteine--tRNA ligase [Bacillota bacterium]|nr:cysteine--tRNA ligase [Bacillota bacterium]HPT87608.1 cysteine--tRNA ligase [Bacillota bacterium]